MTSDNNNNTSVRVSNNEYNTIVIESSLDQVVDFSREEDPSVTISRFLRGVSDFDIVDNLLNGIMYTERRMYTEQRIDNRMMEIAMRESLDQYKTQEKKPNVELCIQGELATKDHLNKSCVICKSDLELNDKITVLECKHILHTECIAEWVKYKSECPTCRSKIHTTFTEQEEKNIDENPV